MGSSDTAKDIKKAYRKLSLLHHPDKKNGSQEQFIRIAKAAEVLGDEEQKELYDYYLDHPREYYNVTGKYYFRALPKADVRLILAGVILFFSVLLPVVQYQKWQRAVTYLRYAAINNLGLKNGGTKETMELYRRAEEKYREMYEQQHTRSGSRGKCPSGSKMTKDPKFAEILDEVVGEVKIEGGYKKPTYEDVFIVKLALFPYYMFMWMRKKYRVVYKETELTEKECLDLAIETIGPGTWDNMTPMERDEVLKLRVWRPGRLESYLKDKETEYLRKNPAQYKRYQRYKKKEKMG